MKVLSLTQPWATLVVLEEKRVETRSWATRYRGPIAIHASKLFPPWCRELCDSSPFREVLRQYGIGVSDLPRGAILGKTSIADCLRTDLIADTPCLYSRCMHEIAFGNYGVGRYGFLLGKVVLYQTPITLTGSLGLWNWTEVEGMNLCPTFHQH